MDGSEDDVLWEEAGENVDPCDANDSGDQGYYCDYDGVDFKLLEKILADTDDEEEFEDSNDRLTLDYYIILLCIYEINN